ncbi:MAG: beta-L-arabinofuranosidase domain-containing protein [Armatimonadota bacterium]
MNRSALIVSSIALLITYGISVNADTVKGRTMVEPSMQRIQFDKIKFDGWLDDYLKNVSDNWLMAAPDANPAMLQMFKDRDRQPYRALLPWSGEFAGKYLTGAVQVYRLTHDSELKDYIKDFVAEMVSCQDVDGYLGPFPKESHLTGRAANCDWTWDAWGHYHAMMGLLLWNEETGDKKALDTAKRIADLFCTKFLNAEPGKRLVDTGSTEMNLAPIHTLCILYRKTGEEKYLTMAKQIADEFAADASGTPLAGDYIRTALEGKEYFQTPKPRWESLHPIMGIAELYWITGDDKYRQAFEHIWWSIVKLDRHNNGGFSSGEQAQGNPYNQGAIETCCTIAWMATGVEMLKLTGNSIVADEIELSTLNSVVGMHSPTGRWVTYNTPMDGVRKASAHDIVFQAREGSPELNCCSVNGARGFGMISDWAVMQDGNGIVVNYYGPSTMTVNLPSGNALTLKQKTGYPVDGNINIKVSPKKDEAFTLKLRIPYWSANTSVKVNGSAVDGVKAGEYLSIDRAWKSGDEIEIDLDMSLHYWVGEKESEGKTSIYRGPVLLTYDRRYNDMDPDQIPTLDASKMDGKTIKFKGRVAPILLMEFDTVDGRKVRLCDFGTAGHAGTPYISWLKVENAPKAEFSKQNPLRSTR